MLHASVCALAPTSAHNLSPTERRLVDGLSTLGFGKHTLTMSEDTLPPNSDLRGGK